MVNTGYISFIVETGGGFDAQRNPIAATKTPSDYFPCNLKPVIDKYASYTEGQFKQAAFSIVIDNSIIPDTIDINSITEVQLIDLSDNYLGIYQVQSRYHSALTSNIKVVV